MLEQLESNTTLSVVVDGVTIVYPGAIWQLTVARFSGATSAFLGNTTLGKVILEYTLHAALPHNALLTQTLAYK